jgi:hypothetical protein
MALSRIDETDRKLGQAVAQANGSTAFIPAVTPVDAAGNSVTGAATAVYRLVSSAASDNATNAAAAACTLRHAICKSNRGSDCYLKIYDKATAPASTDTPKLTLTVPAGGGVAMDFPQGLSFTAGLGYRMTTGSADNDTGAVAAGDVTGLNIVVA